MATGADGAAIAAWSAITVAVVTTIANLMVAARQAKERREDRAHQVRQWLRTERRSVYAAFVGEMQAFSEAGTGMQALERKFEPATKVATQAFDKLRKSMESIELLAESNLEEAMQKLYAAAYRMVYHRPAIEGEEFSYEEARREYQVCRYRVSFEMREELGAYRLERATRPPGWLRRAARAVGRGFARFGRWVW